MNNFAVKVPGEDDTNLSIAVRAVTVQKKKHPLKTVMAQSSSMDTSLLAGNCKRSHLKYEKKYFALEREYAYLPISPEERKAGKKE